MCGMWAKPPEAGSQPARRTNGTGEKASNKQIKFITDIATQRGMSLSDLNADVRHRYGVAVLMTCRAWMPAPCSMS